MVLVQNGLRYGGEFKESKDQHHFQVRKWPFKPPKCVDQWQKKKAALGAAGAGGKRK
jgi:hypothetical protein